MAVESAMRKSCNVKLNLRIGLLKFKENKIWFENQATNAEID